jgi:hypothetical protein
MGSKKALGQARRSWESRVASARESALDVFIYHLGNHLGKKYTDFAATNDFISAKAMYGVNKWFESHQTVYDIDGDLFSALMQSSLPDGPVPSDVLRRLPHDAPLFSLPDPIRIGDDVYTGFIAHVQTIHASDMSGDAAMILWFGHSAENRLLTVVSSQSVLLDEDIPFDEWRKKIIDDLEPGSAESDWEQVTDTLFPMAVNLLLYACSEDADRDPVHPPKGVTAAREGLTGKPLAIHALGWRLGAALRNARSASEGEASHGNGTKAPHVRKAHWHRYWTGPLDGERKIIVRWVPPIEVNIDKGSILPTIRGLR